MLRVLTLNIWNLNHWAERRTEIVSWIDQLRPDLVGLQEVVKNREDGRCQSTWLAERTGLNEAFAPGLDLGNIEFGVGVLSRFPIVATESRELTALDEPAEGRICLRADVETARGPLSFFVTHLNWLFHHGHVREAQVREIADFVDARPEGPNPPILVGDFNAEPDSTEIRFLKGLHSYDGRSFYMQDAYEVAKAPMPGFTWDNRNPYAAENREPDRRIDYVFVGWRSDDGAGQIQSARVVCDATHGSEWPSDHLGVLVEVHFPDA